MNERIKGLKEQALIWAIETLDPDALNDNEWAVAIDEKFAELIIRECVGVVEGGSFLHDQAPTAIFARECSSAIKRHFGVEE
jgi:hypothetical protein